MDALVDISWLGIDLRLAAMDRRAHLQQVKVTTKEIKAGATGGLELAALYLRRSQSLLELHKLPMALEARLPAFTKDV